MVNVYLHGMLGRKFGKEWLGINAKSAAEAMHAIDINLSGQFRSYLAQNPHKEYKIRIGESFVHEEVEVKGPCGTQDVHIVPLIKGRNSGIGKIFAAIVIIALMWWNPGGWASAGGLWGGLGGTLTASGTIAAGIAGALLLGGVSQLMAPKVSFGNTSQDTTNTQSQDFAGNIDTVRQGYPVPVAYGRVLITPLPISVSIVTEDYTAAGILPDGNTVVLDNSFNDGGDIPPNSPVGQIITVGSNQSSYLGSFGNTITSPVIGPNIIPNDDSPYPKNENLP